VAKCTRIAAATCLTLLAAAGTKLQAQSRPQFGPELSFGSNNLGVGIGARVVVPFTSMVPTARNISLVGAFDYFFPSTGIGGPSPTWWELGVGGAYNFSIPKSTITPYAGAGLDIAHWGYAGYGTTDVGLNLQGGAKFTNVGKVTPFGELRLELHSGSAVVITGGILF
jgi:hypothetical protein